MERMKPFERERVRSFLNKLSIEVEDPSTFFISLVHTSYANEQRQAGRKYISSNERLEFLGDAVVDLLICDVLYREYPDASEGRMAKVKAAVASEKVLASLARELGIGEYLFLGKGEENSGGRNRDSILADALEAFAAALYLEKGLSGVKKVLERGLRRYIDLVMSGKLLFDYKTALQEVTQEMYKVLPVYRVVERESDGFEVEVSVNGVVMGRGRGRSKKEAEKEAAKVAYEKIKGSNNTDLPSIRGL